MGKKAGNLGKGHRVAQNEAKGLKERILDMEQMLRSQQNEITNLRDEITDLKEENKMIKTQLFHVFEEIEVKENEKRNRNIIMKNVSKKRKKEALQVLSNTIKKPIEGNIRFVSSGEKSLKIGLKDPKDVSMLCSKLDSKIVKRDLSKLTRINRFVLGKCFEFYPFILRCPDIH